MQAQDTDSIGWRLIPGEFIEGNTLQPPDYYWFKAQPGDDFFLSVFSQDFVPSLALFDEETGEIYTDNASPGENVAAVFYMAASNGPHRVLLGDFDGGQGNYTIALVPIITAGEQITISLNQDHTSFTSLVAVAIGEIYAPDVQVNTTDDVETSLVMLNSSNEVMPMGNDIATEVNGLFWLDLVGESDSDEWAAAIRIVMPSTQSQTGQTLR